MTATTGALVAVIGGLLVARFVGLDSEIRDFRQATTSSFNATREDLTDLRGEMHNGFTEMRGKLDAAAAGQQQIVDLLNTIIDQPGEQ